MGLSGGVCVNKCGEPMARQRKEEREEGRWEWRCVQERRVLRHKAVYMKSGEDRSLVTVEG